MKSPTLEERKLKAKEIHEQYAQHNTEFTVIVSGITIVGVATALTILGSAWLVSDVTALTVIVSGLLGLVTSLTAGIIAAISKLMRVGSQLGEVKTIMDGRLDELLILTRDSAHAKGVLEERQGGVSPDKDIKE